jgi:hypothetical protein
MRRLLRPALGALGALLALLLAGAPASAQEPLARPDRHDPLFLGYGTEPEMDFGGRTVVSTESALSRAIGAIGRVGERHPGLAPAWEFPLGAFLLLAQHEVGGHGGRAREFGLGPSYGFGFDASGFTTTRRPPRTNEDDALLSAAGSEADGVLAHRVLLDLLRPEGVDGAKLPMAMMTKLDLTLYVAQTARPRASDRKGDFPDQLRQGNDIASWLVARQGERVGADPTAVWNGDYAVDYNDPLLVRNWRAARAAALWNLVDPALAAAMTAYFRQHVLGGAIRVNAPLLPFGDGPGWTVGTRAALGPDAVSRFLDLYGAFPWGVATVYVRDLDSSVDRTYGYGAAVHGLRFGGPRRGIELGLAADTWKEPAAREDLGRTNGTGWNVSGEIAVPVGSRLGLDAKVGAKSAGFFPGKPRDKGTYVGLGVEVEW